MKNVFLILAAFLCHFSSLKADPNTQVLVFDFGGVIAQPDRKVFYEFIQRTLHVDSLALGNIRERFKEARKQKVPEFIFWHQLATELGIKLPEDWDRQYDEIITLTLGFNSEMNDLIQTYKKQGYRVGLLSNVETVHAAYLKSHGYYDSFSPVLLSCEIGANKPNNKAYQILLDTLQVEPKNCIFIDDRMENVEAAKKLGIDAILFLNTKQIQAELSQRLSS